LGKFEEYFRTDNGVLYCGNAIEVLKTIDKNSIDAVITSPPYWAKRDYGEDAFAIYGGDPNCEHEWVEEKIGLQHENGNNLKGKQDEVVGKRGTTWIWKHNVKTALICKKCGAWYGQLGLEPTPQMFVEHLADIFDEVKRVLKPTGNLFVNIDDTWVGRGRKYIKEGEIKDPKWKGRNSVPNMEWPKYIKKKSLALIPELFAIKMVYERGWILREKIIWAKKVYFYKDRRAKGNAMPNSVKDRFTHSWEYIFHFTKRQKYYFNWEEVAPFPSDGLMKRVNYSWNFNEKSKSDDYPRSSKTINMQLAEKVKNGQYKVRPNDVIQINVRPFKDAHYAVYPPEIPEILMKAGSMEGGVVLDPFAGAGTTLIVAEKLNRKWIGIEIVPKYCEIIKRRFEKELITLDYSKFKQGLV